MAGARQRFIDAEERLMPALKSVLYHNIAASESGFERGLGVTTDPEQFAQHVAYYRKNYDIIDLGTLLSGNLPKRPLLITFDDCYRSVLTAAREVLGPDRIPSLFFVNPSLVGNQRLSLDNVIAWSANTHGIAAVARTAGADPSESPSIGALVSNILSKRSAAERAALRARLSEAFPIPEAELVERSPALTEEELRELPTLGVEIGNHTAGHVHCGALSADEYGAELVQPKQDLERMSGSRVRSFSVPYGHERDLTPAVLQVLRDSGHEAIFLVHARSNIIRKAPDIWYRVSFQQQPASKIRTRVDVLPLLRTLRHRLRP
jgi:peptidoglycan/xylan/chitin deacetylase (PgdA/CDA1 family)